MSLESRLSALVLAIAIDIKALTSGKVSVVAGKGLSTNDYTTAEKNQLAGLQGALDLKAPLASPAFTGAPTVPTAAAGTNTSQAASTAFVLTAVSSAISSLVTTAPATLDTLNELAAALGNDPNFATTITTALSLKAPTHNPTFTGRVMIPEGTAANPGLAFSGDGAPDTGFYHISDGFFGATCNTQTVAVFGPDGVELRGSPTAPDSATGNNTTRIANTKFVTAATAAVMTAVNAKANGNIVLAAGTDLNTIVTTGFYRLNAPLVNGPAGAGGYGQMIVSKGSNTVLQILADHDAGNVYSRVAVGAEVVGPFTFTAWTRGVNADVSGKLLFGVIAPSEGDLAKASLSSLLEVRGNSATNSAAYMLFHRPGAFAAGFGLDVDNKWKVGGWSYGARAYALYHEGNKPAKADVGLGNVDNTSDANKPVSTAQRAAIDSKALDDQQNLLPNGGLQLGLLGWTTNVGMSTDLSAYWGSVAVATGLGPGIYVANSTSMECAGSTQYTISGDSLFLGTNITGETYFDFEIRNAAGAVILDSDQTAIVGGHDFSDDPNRRLEHKFTVTTPAAAKTMTVRFVANVATGSNVTVGFRRVKVQRGASVGSWSDEATVRYLLSLVDLKLSRSVNTANGTDLNSLTTTGFYRLNGPLVNAPAGSGEYGQMIVSKGSNTLMQIMSDHNNGNSYVRTAVGTTDTGPWTWTAWGAVIYGRNLKTVNGQSVVGAGNVQINATDFLVAKKNSQLNYGSAAVQSESDTGDALIAMHCAGASAFTWRHGRGIAGVRAEDASNALAPVVMSAAVTSSIDAAQTLVLAASASKEYPSFAGILVVTDISGLAAMRMYMCGGGTATLVASHGAMDDFTISYLSSISGYIVFNPGATARTISVLAIRTRGWA